MAEPERSENQSGRIEKRLIFPFSPHFGGPENVSYGICEILTFRGRFGGVTGHDGGRADA